MSLKFKLLPMILLAVFSMATLEIHADHDEVPSQAHSQQQQCDCCIQCCPAHNLAPIQRAFNSTVIPNIGLSVDVFTHQVQTQTIPGSIFRPPIA